jgi:hypothetical protein
MLNPIPTEKYYWTFVDWRDGTLYDADFETKAKALDRANDVYADEMFEDLIPYDFEVSEPLELVRFYYRETEDDTVKEIVDWVKGLLTFERVRLDYEEHGKWN